MAFACKRASFLDDIDVPAELNDDVFVMQGVCGKKAEQERLLGSLLEDELNRSIEKLRELERRAACDTMRLAQLLSGDDNPNSSLGTEEELLEDIEKPILNSSESSSAELVSISTGSPSPVKHYSSFWEGIQNSSLHGPVKKATSGVGDSNVRSSVSPELPIPVTSKEGLMDDREAPASNSSGPDCAELVSFPTGSPTPVKQRSRLRDRMNGTITINQSETFGNDDSEFQVPVTPTDVAQKIMQLSYPVPPKLARLVSVNEIGLHALEHAAGIGSSEGQERSLEKISPKEKSANMTSSPVSSSELPSLSILNLDEVSDSLLSSSLMSSPVKKPSGGQQAVFVENSRDESEVDIEERIKKLCEGLKLSGGESTHNPEAPGTSPPLSPSSRMTFGGACTTLNMEELNDSLLFSFCMAKSPIPEEDSNFLVPTPVAEYKKKLLREQSEGKKSASGHFSSRLGTEGLERLLNETQSVTNKSTLLSDSPKDLDNVLSTDKVIGVLEKLTEGPDTTFVQTSAKPLNNTFNTGENTDEASKKEEVKIQAVNTTFCQVKEVQNETFCAQSNEPANVTFDSKPAKVADTTFGIEGKGKNETFDKVTEMNPVTDGTDANEKNCEKLNVTFEKGEYHIASLNETISLMDAEGEVLQLILDSTPGKPSKTRPGAVSTPKTGNVQEVPGKNTVTKDPAQSFIHRMSLGVRRNAQNTTDNKQQDSVISQPPNLCAALPGLKGGCVSEQSVTNKLRRFQGGQGRAKNGPVRALPLACMSVDSSDDKAPKNTPDGLDGIKALDNINNTPEEGDNKDLSKAVGRPHLPSFGSCSSIENERPSTPDLVPSRGIMTSTPDVSRPTCGSMHPRITSTPATKIGPFSDALGIEGPAPTPIAAPASRSRFIVSTTSSVPEQRSPDNPSLDNLKASSKSDAETANTPAKKSSVVPAAPVTRTQDGRVHSTTDVHEGNPPKYENNEAHETAQLGVENIVSANAHASQDANKVKDCPGALEGECFPVEDMNENVNASLVPQSVGKDNKNQVHSEGKHLSHHQEAASPQVTSIARESKDMHRHEKPKNGEALDELNPKPCSEDVYLKQSEEKEGLVKDINQSSGKQDHPSEVEEDKDGKKSEIAELQLPLEKIEKGQENESDIGRDVKSDLVTKPSESLQPQPKDIEPSAELPQNENHEGSSSTSNKSVRKDPSVISEKVNETKIIDRPEGSKLNQAPVLSKDESRGKGLIKKLGPVSKVNTGVRRSTVEKFNTPTTENKASSLKKKINVNKENIQVSQPRSNVSSSPKVSTANKNEKLRAKLPSHRISLAPSNGQTKMSVESSKKRHASASSVTLRTKTAADKEAEITPNKPLARSSLVRQSAKAILVKPTGIRRPSMKGKSDVPDSAGSKPTSKMQPPSHSSLQPQGTSKLPLEPRSYSGNPVKGVVRTPGNTAPKLLSKLPSKLPTTSSGIPAPSTRTAGGSVSSNSSGGLSRTLKRPGHEGK
ncbi:mucin-17-like [Macrobrachium rosenbergii]|uniref:mucin-17-like n=1 Tax=Macrobrachium rosenbergii TaxID=79674 RepID=UPI0034D6EC43